MYSTGSTNTLSRDWFVHGRHQHHNIVDIVFGVDLALLAVQQFDYRTVFFPGCAFGRERVGVVQSHGGLDLKWQYSGYVSERRYHRSVVLSGVVKKNYVECFGFARAWILYPSQVTTWWLETGGVVVSKSEDFFLPIACSAWLLSSALLISLVRTCLIVWLAFKLSSVIILGLVHCHLRFYCLV